MVIIQFVINNLYRNKYREKRVKIEENRGTFKEHFQTTIQCFQHPKCALEGILKGFRVY